MLPLSVHNSILQLFMLATNPTADPVGTLRRVLSGTAGGHGVASASSEATPATSITITVYPRVQPATKKQKKKGVKLEVPVGYRRSPPLRLPRASGFPASESPPPSPRASGLPTLPPTQCRTFSMLFTDGVPVSGASEVGVPSHWSPQFVGGGS